MATAYMETEVRHGEDYKNVRTQEFADLSGDMKLGQILSGTQRVEES